MDTWSLRFDGYRPADEGLREALCTLGNGYLGTRGACPESAADGVHYPGTYAAGVYNRLETAIAGQVIENESIVNLPNWLALDFRIEGGEWFRVDDVELLDYVQELDMRKAVLTRRLRYRDPDGRTTAVTQRRLVSMAAPHVCALETVFLAEDWSGPLHVRSAIDGRVQNGLVERYRDLAGDHLDLVSAGEAGEDAVLLTVETNRSHVRVAMAARTLAYDDGRQVTAPRRTVQEGAWVAQELTLQLTEGEPLTVEKVVTVFTGRDRAVFEPASEAVLWLGRQPRFSALVERHGLVWRQLWERFGVEVEGSDESQRTLLLHLLHVLQTVSPHVEDLDVGVPPRGLHGEAYRGHILWDELFVFPILNLRMPTVTRSLLRYRYRRLPEARVAAAAAGYRGAMFPWQSGSDGREENQQLHLNPLSGRWTPDPTFRQRHVGLAVAYNVWQYYQVTDDRAFLRRYGAEMIVDIAQFWSSIAELDKSRDRWVIRGVMGPDEFHTGYPGTGETGIDNNAYTNVMAVWVLLRALDALEMLSDRHRQELLERLGVGPSDLERWRDITRRMYVPFHGEGILSQFEGYAELDELDLDRYRRVHGDVQRMDRILEAEHDTPNRYQVSKQADVLMLFYLLSATELRELLAHIGYELDPESIPRTVDYYLRRTVHGSTLSSVVHAWVLARSHRERAVEFFEQTLSADIADIQGGTTKEGIHLAAMAGSVDLLQRCFTGLETRGDRLLLNPSWPASLGTLTFSVVYREQPLTIRMAHGRAEVEAGPGLRRPIEVGCRERVIELLPGARVEFPC